MHIGGKGFNINAGLPTTPPAAVVASSDSGNIEIMTQLLELVRIYGGLRVNVKQLADETERQTISFNQAVLASEKHLTQKQADILSAIRIVSSRLDNQEAMLEAQDVAIANILYMMENSPWFRFQRWLGRMINWMKGKN